MPLQQMWCGQGATYVEKEAHEFKFPRPHGRSNEANVCAAIMSLEGGIRQFTEWDDADAGPRTRILVARYLAAHSPIEHTALQTAEIGRG
jgi:hypothetical protein